MGGHEPSCKERKLPELEFPEDLNQASSMAGVTAWPAGLAGARTGSRRGRLGDGGVTAQNSPAATCPGDPHDCGSSPKPDLVSAGVLFLHSPSLSSPGQAPEEGLLLPPSFQALL